MGVTGAEAGTELRIIAKPSAPLSAADMLLLSADTPASVSRYPPWLFEEAWRNADGVGIAPLTRKLPAVLCNCGGGMSVRTIDMLAEPAGVVVGACMQVVFTV